LTSPEGRFVVLKTDLTIVAGSFKLGTACENLIDGIEGIDKKTSFAIASGCVKDGRADQLCPFVGVDLVMIEDALSFITVARAVVSKEPQIVGYARQNPVSHWINVLRT